MNWVQLHIRVGVPVSVNLTHALQFFKNNDGGTTIEFAPHGSPLAVIESYDVVADIIETIELNYAYSRNHNETRKG